MPFPKMADQAIKVWGLLFQWSEICGETLWRKLESTGSKKAKEYLNYMSFSKSRLISQLEYEGFTKEQAKYAVKKAY